MDILAKEGLKLSNMLILHFSTPCILYQLLADAGVLFTPALVFPFSFV